MESNPTIPITKDYKVLVVCLTYNHSKYIVDALNGFAMQKTNFPFACIVMDDASTDGEPEVIKDWLKRECDMPRAVHYDLDLSDVIVVPHKTNENCTMAVYLLKRNLYTEGALKFELARPWGEHSEYIALCEGDDYWTAPEKLQIQSDYLDAHPEVDMCAHSFAEKNAITGREIRKRNNQKEDGIIPVEDVILGCDDRFSINSIVYRTELEYCIPRFKQYLWLDYSLFIHGALRGGIFYFHRNMSIYRTNVPKSWTAEWKKNKKFQQDITYRIEQMLNILDDETGFRYHSIIVKQKLLNSIVYLNTPFQNIRIVLSNRDVYKELLFSQKIQILGKCICPRLGHCIKSALTR